MDMEQKLSYKLYKSLAGFAEKNLYSKDIQIRDKCFLLFVGLQLIGTIAIIPPIFYVGQYALGAIFTVGLLCLLCELWLIKKYRKYEIFEILTCVLFQLMIPPAFFMSGGFSGGILFMFLMSIVLSYLVLTGKRKYIHICFCLVVMAVTVMASIKHPEWTEVNGQQISQTTSMIANTVSCITCGFVLICILSFQMYLHNQQEEMLRIKEEEAHSASVAKSMFLANMSHEIRTPMGVVIGLSDMIQQENNIDVVHGMAKNINRTSGLLLNIINDILDFEKVSKGMMEIIDVEYKMADIIGDFKNIGEGRCASKGLAFSVKVTESVPEFLLGDETRFRQVGTNIINNAIKYTDKGYVDVIIDYNQALQKLILIVKDSGKGIKEEDLPFIFDSFQRSDVKNNRHIEGTGLGLAITKKLTQAMGGTVSVISEYGKGSVFTVELPHKKLESISEVKKETSEEYDFSGKKIFYVDDTKVNTLVFNGMLKNSGAETKFAFSGQEALDIIKAEKFDIIFLDYFMPGMDGVDVFKSMREMGIETPIIVLTADAVNDAKKKFLDIGFDDYLSKPIQRPALFSTIDKYTK